LASPARLSPGKTDGTQYLALTNWHTYTIMCAKKTFFKPLDNPFSASSG
jgi:hypothetical protein